MVKRTVDRNEKLPAIRCDLADLESLVDKIIEHFGADSNLTTSIDVDLKTENLVFEDFSDMRAYNKLPAKLMNFRIWISDQKTERRCTIRAGGLFLNSMEVTATSNNEAWCAGVIELSRDFSQRHKQWYHFINKFPFFGIFCFLTILPIIIKGITGKEFITYYFLAGWLLAIASLGILSLIRSKSFPPVIIIIRHEKAKWREYVPELSLAIAVLALIVTFIGFIIQIKK